MKIDVHYKPLRSKLHRVNVHYLEDLSVTVGKIIPNDATRMKEHFRLFREKYLPDFEETT